MFVVTYARGSKEHVDAQQERMVRSLQPEDTVVGSYSDLTNGMDTGHGTDLPRRWSIWPQAGYKASVSAALTD